MCWMYGCAIITMYSLLASVSRLQLFTSRVKNRLFLMLIFKICSVQIYPPFFLLFPIGCLFKSPYSLIGSTVKNLKYFISIGPLT